MTAVIWLAQCQAAARRSRKRRLAVFPGPFTLEAAEAVAGAGAGPVVLHLVDCSLLTPPRAGPDGRARYLMLETLRAYGLDRLAEADEQHGAAATLAGYALRVAEQAAADMRASAREQDAARWLDAEDATTQQALAWALDHDHATALRLAVALSPWWQIRGRLTAEYALLRDAVEHAAPGSGPWLAGRFWLGQLAHRMANHATALSHFTAFCDTLAAGEASRELADGLAARSAALRNLGRLPEAVDDARRALAMAQELGYPAEETLALVGLSVAACYVSDSPRFQDG